MIKRALVVVAALAVLVTASPAQAVTFAGYDHGSSNSLITASINVPTLTCGTGQGAIAGWVGIDSEFLSQTGWSTWCSGGSQTVSLWYENYPNPPHNYTTVTASPGQRLDFKVELFNSGNTQKFTVTTGAGASQTITTSVNSSPGRREWLVEGNIGGNPTPKFTQILFKRNAGFPDGADGSHAPMFALGAIQSCGPGTGSCEQFWVRDAR